jgi:hypothetical protein
MLTLLAWSAHGVVSLMLAALATPHPAYEWSDCNRNGVEDAVDIALGSSADLDRNGVPDECDGAATERATARGPHRAVVRASPRFEISGEQSQPLPRPAVFRGVGQLERRELREPFGARFRPKATSLPTLPTVEGARTVGSG